MKDENKINSCPNVHSKNVRQINVLFTGLPRLFQRLAMTAGRLAKYPESRHSGAREAIHTLGRRHCERSEAIQSQKRTRQRSQLSSRTPAFTIVELLVVIVVIAILAAITIVGYRSVSSNARKSVMASDLEQANKSLQVNKETSSSETFPSTLSGAGITLSNNATYSYNVSADGSNYCLQGTVDGVTKSIAGNNQTVSNSTCVSATNLITNGDFSQGTSGWTALNASNFSANKVASFTATAQWGGLQASLNSDPAIGHKYYFAVNIKGSSVRQAFFYDGTNYYVQTTSLFGDFQKISSVFTMANNVNRTFMVQDANTSNWTETQFKNAIVIDLTATFGAGNEPTAAQMDAILVNFPNFWFNGANLIQKPTS